MERTEELLRSVLHLLPPPRDSIIVLPDDEVGGLDAGGAAQEAGSAAGELGGAAVPEACRGSGGPGARAADDYGRASGVLDSGSTSNGAAEGALADGQESEGRTVYRQSSDLYLYGRPLSNWEDIWKNTALFLHDLVLLDASWKHRDKKPVAVDFTQEITAILGNHPGPVSQLRIDSSIWSGGDDQLGVWMETASGKGIEQLIIINIALPTNLVFPIHTLQSPILRRLYLGFMHLGGLAVGAFDYSCLTELCIFGCTYSGKALSAVISECSSLRALVIVSSVKRLRLVSQSLVSLEMSMCTADSLIIEYAPKLHILATGIRPRTKGHRAVIDINSTHSLTDISYWMLPHHNIQIRSSYAEKRIMYLPRVRKLRLGVAMADPHQIYELVRVLQFLPYLTHLTLWRMDEADTGEGSDEAIRNASTAFSSLPCVSAFLQYLLMEDFRGGPTEKTLIRCVLWHAAKLLEVRIESNVRQEGHSSLADVKLELLCLHYHRLSEQCQIIFQTPQ